MINESKVIVIGSNEVVWIFRSLRWSSERPKACKLVKMLSNEVRPRYCDMPLSTVCAFT